MQGKGNKYKKKKERDNGDLGFLLEDRLTNRRTGGIQWRNSDHSADDDLWLLPEIVFLVGDDELSSLRSECFIVDYSKRK